MNSNLRPMHRAPIVSRMCLPFIAAPVDSPAWLDRRQVFHKKLFGPQAILENVPGSAFDTVRGFPRQWGRGLGVAGRLRSQHGQCVVEETIELALTRLRHALPGPTRSAWRGLPACTAVHPLRPHGTRRTKGMS